MKIFSTLMIFSSMMLMGGSASAQQVASEAPLYFHAYKPALNGSFQLQPEQGFAIIEPFSNFVRMVQVCVRDAKSVGVMPIPTPALATRTRVGATENTGTITVGSCAVLEGESISVGLADGTVDADTSDGNKRKALAYMSGSYTILGYYSTEPPVPAPSAEN